MGGDARRGLFRDRGNACYSVAVRRATASGVGMVAILLAIGGARAAGASVEDAAETMFQRGLADMLAGRYGSGCPAIAESLRLERRPGTLFTLAECEARAGLIASALEHYDAFLQLVAELSPEAAERQRERRRIASEQRANLSSQVPLLTIRLPPEAAAGTVVRRDDVVVDQAALGTAINVDPGPHLVTAAPPGSATVAERRFVLRPGERKELTFAPAELVPTGGDTISSLAPPLRPAQDDPARHLRWKRWGTQVAIASVVLAAAGGAALWIAKRKIDAINAAHRDHQHYDEGSGNYPTYQAAGAGLLVSGAAALIAAGVFYFVGSRPLVASGAGSGGSGNEAGPPMVSATLRGTF